MRTRTVTEVSTVKYIIKWVSAHGGKRVEDIPVAVPVVHILPNGLCAGDAKVCRDVMNQLLKTGGTIRSAHVKVSFMRGNLSNSSVRESMRILKQDLTLSELSKNTRRWWVSSKGERRANTATATTVKMFNSVTAFMRTFSEKRRENGATSGAVIESMTATIDAITCSACASAPIRPVCNIW